MAGAGREGGAIPVMGAQGEARLLWVPLADTAEDCDECLPRRLWTYVVPGICRTFRTRHLPTVMVDPVRANYARHQTCQE